MEKKYELIKWYPSLNDNLKEGMCVEWYKGCYRSTEKIPGGEELCKEEVEDYPEFWKKVEEKDYEILSFIDNDGYLHEYKPENTSYKRYFRSEGWNGRKPFGWYGSLPEKYCLENYKIHAVKRLSDGEVFTVGDKLYLGEKRSNEILAEIKIIDDKLRFKAQFQIDLNHSWSSSYTLDFIQHAKKSLFTTEDGVDIYEGDKYWWVTSNYLKDSKLANKNSGECNTYKYFSTKEKADEYIEWNKPTVSKKQIHDAIANYNEYIEREKFLEFIGQQCGRL